MKPNVSSVYRIMHFISFLSFLWIYLINRFSENVVPPFIHWCQLSPNTPSVRWITHNHKHSTYLYCWWSLVLLVLAMKRSASFSRLREYSISISAFFRKKSWRSCRSWTLISVCCSIHFCCSTSWARISAPRQGKKSIKTFWEICTNLEFIS